MSRPTLVTSTARTTYVQIEGVWNAVLDGEVWVSTTGGWGAVLVGPLWVRRKRWWEFWRSGAGPALNKAEVLRPKPNDSEVHEETGS